MKIERMIKLVLIFLLGVIILLSLIFFSSTLVYSLISLAKFSNPKTYNKEILKAVPNEKSFYETAFNFAERNKNQQKFFAEAMIVPHHLLAGDVIASAYDSIQDGIETVVLIGPDHFNTVKGDILVSDLPWETPSGEIEPDQDLISQLNEVALKDNSSFSLEHSINSQVAFIKKTFPKAKIVPIIIKSTVKDEELNNLLERLESFSKEKKILLIGSMDFSHNLPLAKTLENDKQSLENIEEMKFENIKNTAVDSWGTLWLVMKYAQFAGAEFNLINNTNSAILADKPDQPNVTSYITGVFAKKNATELAPVSKNNFKFLFFGDLMLDRHVGEKIKSKGLPFLFSELDKAGVFKGCDFVSANLEGAVTDNGAHYKPDNAYDFAFKPDLINELKKYNFSYFSNANNHLADQGRNGIMETEKNLAKMGFIFSGCQDSETGACSATTTVINGKKIGLISFSQVYRSLNREKILDIVRNIASTSDITIVNIHWGIEYEHNFSKTQQELGRGLVDAGADMVIGHHPHVVQGVEIYKNKPIFFSLGNFIFDQYFSADTQEELGISINWEANKSPQPPLQKGAVMEIGLLPMRSKGSQPYLLTGAEKEAFLKKFVSWSNVDNEIKKQVEKGNLILY